MNAPIAIAPMHNSAGKKDATGAFLPEARQFAKLHGGKVLTFDNRKPARDRFVEVIDLLRGRQAHCVAFFCHGLKTSLQVGATLRNVHVLAAALKDIGCTTVPLFACDTARDADRDHADDMADGPGGSGGFASALSAALPAARVLGHTLTAHTSKAPYVREFRGGGDGEWLIEPGSPWWRTWKKALQDDPAFRLSFPLWAPERLLAELARRAAA